MKKLTAGLSVFVSAIVVVLALSAPAAAHLMVAGHGTLNIVNNNVFMVLSLPLSAFEGIDDNADGEIDLTEFNRHQAAVIKTVKQHVSLRDKSRALLLEDVLLSAEKAHDHNGHHHNQISEVIVMGRFTLGAVHPPLSFHVGIYGEGETGQVLNITASHKAENLRYKFQLTPEQPTRRLFP